jgi:hypothetical protein
MKHQLWRAMIYGALIPAILIAGVAVLARRTEGQPKVKIVDWNDGIPVTECNGPGEEKCADCSAPGIYCMDLHPDHDPVGSSAPRSFEDKKRMYRQDIESILREHPELDADQQARLRALLDGLQPPSE